MKDKMKDMMKDPSIMAAIKKNIDSLTEADLRDYLLEYEGLPADEERACSEEKGTEPNNEIHKRLRTIAHLSEEMDAAHEQTGVLERKNLKGRQRKMQLLKEKRRLTKKLDDHNGQKKSSLTLSCAVCKSTRTLDFSTGEQKLGAFATCKNCRNGEAFFISVEDHHGDTTKFRIHKKIKMKTIFEAYANERGLKVELFSFFVDGKQIGPDSTAGFLGLKDKDTIDCQYNSAVLEFFRFIRKEVHEANPGVNL
ncbi:hypothetical protein ACHAXR_005097, partial [Thalassiosira sp. AJA248-18]